MLCSHSSAPGASVASRTVSVFCACAVEAANRLSNSSFDSKRMVLSFVWLEGGFQVSSNSGVKRFSGAGRRRGKPAVALVADRPLEDARIVHESGRPEAPAKKIADFWPYGFAANR